MGFLIDTCIWIDVERGRLAPGDIAAVTADQPVFLSPVTLAELQMGAEIAADVAIRQRRFAALERLARKPVLSIDGHTGTIFGRLAAQIRAGGRGHRYRIQDLWLASQAIQYNYCFMTRNLRDFEDIPGLELVVMP